MCLRIKRDAVEMVAEEDITCYKVLRRNGVGESTMYRAPFVMTKISDSCIYGKVPYEADGQPLKVYNGNGYNIGAGLIHTLKNKDGGRFYPKIFKERCYMFECKIPKGTKYYVGVDDFERECYGSRQIVFGPQIEILE